MRQRVIASAIVLLVLCGVVAPAGAQQCGSTVGIEGFGTLNQQVVDVEVIGNLAYALDVQGLTIYDITDPSNIRQIGQLPLDRDLIALAVAGGMAHLLGDRYGVWVADVSDPSSPQLMSHVWLSSVRAVAAADGIGCYVGSSWMKIVDVSDPSSPQILSTYDFDSVSYTDVVLDEKRAYVAQWRDGLLVLDISDPTAPTEVLQWTDGPVMELDVWQRTVYFGDFTTLRVLQTDGPVPVLGGAVELPGDIEDVVFADGWVLAVCESAGLQIVDVSSSPSPSVVGTLGDLQVDVVGSADALAVVGGEEGLLGVDLTDPAAPVITDTLSTEGFAYDVEVLDPYAFVADGAAGLLVVEIADPAASSVVGSLPVGDARSVALSDGFVYVLDGTTAMVVVDVSDPTEPLEVGGTSVVAADTLIASEGVVYALDQTLEGHSELRIVDATNPQDPSVVGSLELSHNVLDLAVADGIVYLAADQDLLVVDVVDPTSPVVVTELEIDVNAVEVIGEIVFIGCGRWFTVLNMSDPMTPLILGTLELDVRSNLGVLGTMAYGIGSNDVLRLFDVSELAAPKLIGEVPMERDVRGLAAAPFSSTVWAAEGSVLHGVAIGCPDCVGLSSTAAPPAILTGGETTEVTVMVEDRFGNLSRDQSLVATPSLGSLDPFIDNGDGTYTSSLTSGAESGWVELELELNGEWCGALSPARFLCAAGTPQVPTRIQLDPGPGAIRVSWQPSAGARGYRVERGPSRVLSAVDGDMTQIVDSTVSPGREYCYSVAAIDSCGGPTDASAEVCTETSGAAWTCPRRRGRTHVSYGYSSDLALLDGNVVVADSSGLNIFSLATPPIPRWIGVWYAPRAAKGVDVVGQLAYVTVWESSLSIVDLSDPTSPVMVNSLSTDAIWHDVEVVDGIAYLANRDEGLDVVDVRDPMALELIGRVERPGRWERLDVAGGFVYLVDDDHGTMIVDVSVPSVPTFLTLLETPREPQDVAVEAGRAYIVDDSMGFVIVDVSDPLDPVILGSSDEPARYGRVAVSGNLAYVGDVLRDLRVFDVSDPTAPVVVGIVEFAKPPSELIFSDGLVGITSMFRGLEVIDVTEPMVPEVVASMPPYGFAKGVAFRGDIAFVGCSEGGLRVIDLADAERPVILATMAAMRGAYGVDLVGDNLYTSSQDGLLVFDVSVPEVPVAVGSVETGLDAAAVEVSEGFAYIANGAAGLKVVDVTDPTAPGLVGTLDTSGDARDVAVEASMVYVADGNALLAVNVADPADPRLVWQAGGTVDACSVHNGYLYSGNRLYNGSQVVEVYSLSDPGTPRKVASVEVPGFAIGTISAHNEYVYAGCSDRVAVIDVTAPFEPELVTVFVPGGPIGDVVFENGSVFVAASGVLDQFTLSCGVPGDLDGNGWIDWGDIPWLLEVIYHGSSPHGDPDADGSGAVDSGDLSTVLDAL